MPQTQDQIDHLTAELEALAAQRETLRHAEEVLAARLLLKQLEALMDRCEALVGVTYSEQYVELDDFYGDPPLTLEPVFEGGPMDPAVHDQVMDLMPWSLDACRLAEGVRSVPRDDGLAHGTITRERVKSSPAIHWTEPTD